MKLFSFTWYVALLPLLAFMSALQVFGQPANEQDLLLNQSYAGNRRYDQVCWLTAHNAFANTADGWNYAQQSLSLDDQFFHGVRSFMIDLYWYNPGSDRAPYIALCHEDREVRAFADNWGAGAQNCILTRVNRGFRVPQPATHFFDHVHRWLTNDPTAIITVHIESQLGANARAALRQVLQESDVERFLYDPGILSPATWPTLEELRKNNQRLIIFSDNPRDGFIHVRAYQETRFNLGEFAGCEMRGNGRAIPESNPHLFVMNHFYSASFDIPIVGTGYAGINSAEAILERVNTCYVERNRLPNFIAVDFVQLGNNGGARSVALRLNQLPVEHFEHFVKPITLQEAPNHTHDEL